MGNNISYTTSTTHLHIPNTGLRIQGLQNGTQSRRFTGVPYAKPPVGPLRWRKPKALPLSELATQCPTFDATTFGPVCPQANYSKSVSEHIPVHTYSEDCLRLNIWTPVPDPANPDRKYPVMIWFHGGWFQVGDPSQEAGMDPTELISTGGVNCVFVAVGYRLNIFGFLAGDALRQESGNREVGNYGLWDQRLAIEWVYEHIEHFGGDPENLILSGRSAGAYAVQAQVLFDFRAAPDVVDARSRDVFRRLVMYSNAIPTQPKTPEDCQAQFDEVCASFGIETKLSGEKKLERLRGIEAMALCDAIMKLEHHTFRPVTDGVFIQPGIFDYFQDGSFAAEFKRRGLRLLIGEVRDENTLYAVTNSPRPNVESFRLQVQNYYSPATTERLLRHYELPSTDTTEEWQAVFGHLIADGQVRAPSRFLIKNLLEHGVDIQDVWRYLIAYRLSFITDNVAPASFGVSHAMDRPIWNYSIMHGPNPDEKVLMDAWIRDLAAFVNNEEGYSYGTRVADEYKVMTPEGKIAIQKDARWEHLLKLMDVFSGAGGVA
ncbi:carboxylesterase [Aspergillus homomorphus CBS 101889]|uniref:Carboxylic ester hydrolase n=1 Tax=Aspergillus homomorphus (strain CBS 101889) TaxID=1450537 RepID=A0A395I4K1_ASPHC|nr:carboxylesterase [Aspergillus homomorphus CBS 101889]RAL14676.1 carboxylesterase [Aspergillus homomorphus CBS 101889]